MYAFAERKCETGKGQAKAKVNILFVHGVLLFKLVEHADLDLACVAILLDCTDDLDGDVLAGVKVAALDNLAKRALTEQADDFIWSKEGVRTRTEYAQRRRVQRLLITSPSRMM
jgi:hypothetical protein